MMLSEFIYYIYILEEVLLKPRKKKNLPPFQCNNLSRFP